MYYRYFVIISSWKKTLEQTSSPKNTSCKVWLKFNNDNDEQILFRKANLSRLLRWAKNIDEILKNPRRQNKRANFNQS